MDDSQIKKLQELLEQATRLRDCTNQLIDELTGGLAAGDNDPSSFPDALAEPLPRASPKKA